MYIVGIAGGSGSGKTTFAHKLVEHVGKDELTLIHMDSYYLPSLPSHLKTSNGRLNFDHPEAFDWELLTKHLKLLKEGKSIQVPIYDFKTNSRTSEVIETPPTKVILFEGIFALFDKQIRQELDILCFLHVDADIRFARRINRDVKERGRNLEDVIAQYYDTVRPMYQKFLDPQKQYADFTIGEETNVAASILSAKLRELLSHHDNPNYDPAFNRGHEHLEDQLSGAH